MKKLLLSFTGTLQAMASGALSVENLQTALFFFGCARQHALQPGASGEVDERKWFAGAQEAHVHLVHALERAEKDSRCRWYRRTPGADLDPLVELNELLTRNGLQPVADFEFDRNSLKQAVIEANPSELDAFVR